MQALRNFITEENRWQSMWNSNYPQLDLATSTGRANIAERLSDTIPENLHCDGEISNAEAQRKYVRLERVALATTQVRPNCDCRRVILIGQIKVDSIRIRAYNVYIQTTKLEG